MKTLTAPAGSTEFDIEGIKYHPDANGHVQPLSDAHEATLRALGCKDAAEQRAAVIEAAAPDPDKDTIENMTAWLIDRGVQVPNWRDLLAANVRRVIELQKAGVIPGPDFSDAGVDEPAEPEKTPVAGDDDLTKRGVAEIPADPDEAARKILTAEDVHGAEWIVLKTFLKNEGVAVAGNASREVMVSTALAHIAAKAQESAAGGQDAAAGANIAGEANPALAPAPAVPGA